MPSGRYVFDSGKENGEHQIVLETGRGGAIDLQVEIMREMKNYAKDNVPIGNKRKRKIKKH